MLLSGEIFEIAAAPATNWLCHLIMNYLSVASLRPTVWWLLYAAFTISSSRICLFTCFILPSHYNLINHRDEQWEEALCPGIVGIVFSRVIGVEVWEEMERLCLWGDLWPRLGDCEYRSRSTKHGSQRRTRWGKARRRVDNFSAETDRKHSELKKAKKDCYVNRLSGGTQSKAAACICRTQTSPCISACFWRWILKKCYSPLIASIGWRPIPPFFLIPLISRLFSALFSSLSSCSPPRVALSQTASHCELVFHDLFLISCQFCCFRGLNPFDWTSETCEYVIYIGMQQLINDNW